MATRSTIGMVHADRSVSHVYCHSDGYPSWNGKRLQKFWASEDKVHRILARGGISVLGEVVGKQHDFDWRYKWREENQHLFEKEVGGYDWDAHFAAQKKDPRARYTTFYTRDRGDTEGWVRTQRASRWDDDLAHCYTYLWCEVRSMWLVGIWDKEVVQWRKLTDVLALAEPTQENPVDNTMDDNSFVLEQTEAISLYPPSLEDQALDAAQEAVAIF